MRRVHCSEDSTNHRGIKQPNNPSVNNKPVYQFETSAHFVYETNTKPVLCTEQKSAAEPVRCLPSAPPPPALSLLLLPPALHLMLVQCAAQSTARQRRSRKSKKRRFRAEPRKPRKCQILLNSRCSPLLQAFKISKLQFRKNSLAQ